MKTLGKRFSGHERTGTVRSRPEKNYPEWKPAFKTPFSDRSQFALRKCSHSFRSRSHLNLHSSVHIQIAVDLRSGSNAVSRVSSITYRQTLTNQRHWHCSFASLKMTELAMNPFIEAVIFLGNN